MTADEEHALLIAMCQAHDREDAAQKGEPSPWEPRFMHADDETNGWIEERVVAMREALTVAKAALLGVGAEPERNTVNDFVALGIEAPT